MEAHTEDDTVKRTAIDESRVTGNGDIESGENPAQVPEVKKGHANGTVKADGQNRLANIHSPTSQYEAGDQEETENYDTKGHGQTENDDTKDHEQTENNDTKDQNHSTENKGQGQANGFTVMYGRIDTTLRQETIGFEHNNSCVLFNDGREVMVKKISPQEALTSNLVQCTNVPLSPSCRYYRMTINALDEGQFVMFGLTNKCLPGYPMWTIDRSVRYHSNDGGVFNGGLGVRTYHPYGVGDTVTCRLDYVGPDRSLINFLLNDCFVYRQWVNLPPDQLYATIGLSRTHAQLTVEWPESSGREDVEIRNDLLSNWFGWKGIARDNDAMTFTLSAYNEQEREGYNVQCPLAFSNSFHYYEVEIKRKAEKAGHGLGVVSGNCDTFVFPGWAPQSLGFHSDDGGLYVNGEQIETHKDFICKAGDRMGCGVVFPKYLSGSDEREPVLLLIYFTKNRKLVYTKRMRQPRGGFFPCIAMNSKDDSFKLDVHCEPPPFDEDLHLLLTRSEVSVDYRCNETFTLHDMTQTSVTVRMTSQTETAQLLQFRAETLRDLGDRFSIVVTEVGPDTEIQMGVSTETTKAEGEFLGAESTTCGYMLKLGTIVSSDGMRAVEKFNLKLKQKISCYLDYIDDAGAVLCFTINDRLIGRGVVNRATGCSTALYATIVMSAGPAEIKADWTGILKSNKIVRKQKNAEDWIRPTCIDAKGHNLELKSANGYAFAVSAQSSLPLVTGTSIFSIRLLSASKDFPGVGLSRATHDVSSVLGAENGEVCFVPSGRHILANNMKKKLNSTPEIKLGDTIQCGVVFTRAQDRVTQKVVVFFAVNHDILYHCTMMAAYGGLYPTVAFSPSGGSVEVIDEKTVLPVPEHISNAWKRRASDSTPDFTDGSYVSFHDDRPPSAAGEVDAAMPIPMKVHKINIYASHTFADRERVDGVMRQLQKHQPYVGVETSTSRASMQDKNDALARADLVVMFVNDAYYSSHEMQTEYTGIIRRNNIPAVICALDNKGWPPHTYFQQLQDELSKLPWVELTLTDHGRPSITPLERFVEKKLKENATFEHSEEEIEESSRPSSAMSTKKKPNYDYHSNSSSSKTCQIL